MGVEGVTGTPGKETGEGPGEQTIVDNRPTQQPTKPADQPQEGSPNTRTSDEASAGAVKPGGASKPE